MDIITATRQNNIKLVEELIKAGGDINLQDEDGNTSLINSIFNNNLEIVMVLIDAKADLNLQNKFEDTALIYASYCGYIEIVEVLINAKANLNLQDDNGETALIGASRGGHLKIVEELIKAKANLNLQDKYGNTALINSILRNNLEIGKELIKANTDLVPRSGTSRTACSSTSTNIDNKFIKNIKKYDINILKLLVNKNFNIALEYIKKFNKQKDSDVDSSESTSMASHARSIKYYVSLLIINHINKLNINQYEKGLINIILNYYIEILISV
jgi:ankyrin repeat protein